jgi:hypothetical protein
MAREKVSGLSRWGLKGVTGFSVIRFSDPLGLGKLAGGGEGGEGGFKVEIIDASGDRRVMVWKCLA